MAKKQTDGGAIEHFIDLLPAEFMKSVNDQIKTMLGQFESISDNNMTALERRRKTGAGTRIYGFIDEVSDLARANPHYAQFFRVDDLKNCMRNIEMCRNSALLLSAFARAMTNSMLVYSTAAHSMSLNYYNIVKQLSRHGDPNAMELYKTLQRFFKKRKRSPSKPTQKQVERDAHALLTGKKDGRIVVENVSSHG